MKLREQMTPQERRRALHTLEVTYGGRQDVSEVMIVAKHWHLKLKDTLKKQHLCGSCGTRLRRGKNGNWSPSFAKLNRKRCRLCCTVSQNKYQGRKTLRKKTRTALYMREYMRMYALKRALKHPNH